MNEKIPDDILKSVEIAMTQVGDQAKAVRQAMIELLMAERQRCYDLAYDVCNHDYDGVTGSLDDDIMNGVIFKKPEPVTTEELRASLFSSVAYQKMFIKKMQDQFDKGVVSGAPSGVKDSTIRVHGRDE